MKSKKVERVFFYLYEIPRESKIMCEVSDGSTYVTFHHIDGLYSFCTTEKNNTAHLRAYTLLEKVKDGVYRINDEEKEM